MAFRMIFFEIGKMTMTTTIIKGVETAEEEEGVLDQIAKIHFHGYYPARSQLGTYLANYPEYRREHTRILLVDGQLASCLCLFTHTIRIGEARMKMGGIGNVTTVGPYRGRGYAALLMSDTMRFMKARGYHVSTLFGIADFYHRWGFSSVLPEYASVIDLRETMATPGRAEKTRAMKPGDISSVLLMHNRNDAASSCSIIRSSGHFSNRWERWRKARVMTDSRGRVVAYYLGRPAGEEFQIDELGALDRTWFDSLLRACVANAHAEYTARVRLNIPPSHDFVKFLMQYRSDHETHVYRNSNGMVAAVNLEETLECMIPEWESSLLNASATSLCATVTLLVDRNPCRIRAHRGAIDVAAVPGENKVSLSTQEFVQVLTGHRYIDELVGAKRRSLNPAALPFLRVLFPKRTPYVWQLDRF